MSDTGLIDEALIDIICSKTINTTFYEQTLCGKTFHTHELILRNMIDILHRTSFHCKYV